MKACFLVLGLFLLGALGMSDALAEERANEPEFFDKRIRPILVEHCYKCHGPDRNESELRVDSYAAISSGGVSGDFIVPGKPDESLLLIAIGYQNEDLQMPPDGKLGDNEIELLKQWVANGAVHPDAPKNPATHANPAKTIAASDLWSLKPPVARSIPRVKNEAWLRTPIDAFVLAKLEEKGLTPSLPADKRTFIRRLTFGLIGLPPTVEEVQAFLQDDSPQAYAKVVDHLLASPHYGERWGRHWLDVARYADSNGLDENVAHGNAWRYRDYVIDALNNDKSYDDFIREQVAGDLLPAEDATIRHEHLVATGFLSLGAKVLAEVDERKMEMDIVDEQIDTLGRAVLGLTFGCARCHDHKFDPILTEDYYALAGVFRSTKTMESFTKVARWNESVIATPAEVAASEVHEKKITDQKVVIAQFIEAANKTLVASLGADAKLPADAESRYPQDTKTELKKLRDELARIEKAATTLSSAMGVVEGVTADTAVCIRGSHLTLGAIVPRGVPTILASAAPKFPTSQSGRKELADWLVGSQNPLTARVMVNRVWRWHFGRGLVESTDNFGQLGDRPENAPLLDWLAVWFMESGWSMKKLQRLIVTSAVYMQSSATESKHDTTDLAVQARSALATVTDPDNRLLWHFPVRRLEAEVIRDSLLAVSGQLDTAHGGSLLQVANRGYLFDHTSKDETKYDSRKRSVYLPVIRNNLYDVFHLFDSTDATVPSGDRASSTVATQALFMMNSPLIMDAAQQIAGDLGGVPIDEARRVKQVYARCLGRLPTVKEVERASRFVEQFANLQRGETADPSIRLNAWTAFCHTLLASNEFIFVQ